MERSFMKLGWFGFVNVGFLAPDGWFLRYREHPDWTKLGSICFQPKQSSIG
jgi:hypothetical protein